MKPLATDAHRPPRRDWSSVAAAAARAWLRPFAPPLPRGLGLELHPWDAALQAQMAAWGEHGFPFHAFDLAHLRDPDRAGEVLEKRLQSFPHLHFVAVEDGAAVGRVSVNLADPAGLYIWSVHVPPEHEGRGVCRRMLTILMPWLAERYAGRDFVMTSNTFATRAHRAYLTLGFTITSTRWQYDSEMAAALWKLSPLEREQMAAHTRFSAGLWETKAYVFKLPSGSFRATGTAR